MNNDDLCDLSAVAQAALIRDREVSSVELLQAHLDRIDRVNPSINAIVTRIDDEALETAKARDQETVAGRLRGPLHGLPIAFKDTHITGGLRTTHGSPLCAHDVPEEDELVVARLRAAGSVCVGKTNVPEFGAGSHSFNPVFGTTLNPWDTTRSAGGSSGGAAAALAAGLVPLADGSDCGGSLRNPAAFCNVVGFRPTPGRVPTVPDKLPWLPLVVQGPMGRTVDDAALMLSVMAGPDPRAPLSLGEPGTLFHPPLGGTLHGLRVAWAPDLAGRIPVDPQVRAVLERSVHELDGLGAHVSEACPDLTGADEVFDVLRAWGIAMTLGDVVREHGDEVKHAVRWNVELGQQLQAQDVARAQRLQGELYLRTVGFFEDFDVLLAPSTQVLPFPAEEEYPHEVAGHEMPNYLEWMRACSLITSTGCPAISVPAGFTDGGLPVGVQIIGPPRADLRVLQVARAWEDLGHGDRRLPLLRETAPSQLV